VVHGKAVDDLRGVVRLRARNECKHSIVSSVLARGRPDESRGLERKFLEDTLVVGNLIRMAAIDGVKSVDDCARNVDAEVVRSGSAAGLLRCESVSTRARGRCGGLPLYSRF